MGTQKAVPALCGQGVTKWAPKWASQMGSQMGRLAGQRQRALRCQGMTQGPQRAVLTLLCSFCPGVLQL